MKTKTKLMFAAMLLAIGATLCGCEKGGGNGEQTIDVTPPPPPPVPPTMTIESVGEPLTKSITVKFQASETAVSYAYAIGTDGDSEAFEAGTMEGITVVSEDVKTAKTVTFDKLTPETTYTIFARATGEEELVGDTKTLALTTAALPEPAIAVDVVKFNCTIATLRYTLNETAKGGIAAFLPIETYNKLNTSDSEFLEQLLSMAALGAGAMTYEKDTEQTWYIRSKPEQEFKMVNLIIYTGDDGKDTYRLVTKSYFTPEFDANAAEAEVEVEITKNERYTLELKFTPNDATYCFQHKILNKMFYDMALTNAQYMTAFYDDILKTGNQHYAGVSTFNYDHTKAQGMKAGETWHVIGILYNDNGASPEIKVLETFTVPAS